MTLHISSGKSFRIPLHLNAKEIQLFAYIAWLHGQSKRQTISLDKLREHVFGYDRPDEDATPKKLQDAFDSAKKEIRRAIGVLHLVGRVHAQASRSARGIIGIGGTSSPSLVCKQWKETISFSKCLFPERMSNIVSTGSGVPSTAC